MGLNGDPDAVLVPLYDCVCAWFGVGLKPTAYLDVLSGELE